MAVDSFLKFQEFQGESKDSKHSNEIELISWSLGASNPASVTAGGLGAGKVNVSDINVTALVDQSTPKLFQACCQGQHLKNAVLTHRKAGTDQQEFLVVTMTDVLISHWSVGGSGHGGDIPSVSFNLAFANIKIDYKTQDEKGGLGGAVTGMWDLKKNAAAAAG